MILKLKVYKLGIITKFRYYSVIIEIASMGAAVSMSITKLLDPVDTRVMQGR